MHDNLQGTTYYKMCKVVKMTYEIMNCFKMRNNNKKRLEVLQRGEKKVLQRINIVTAQNLLPVNPYNTNTLCLKCSK